MGTVNRRSFLQSMAGVGAALALPGSRVLGANDDIRIGMIGLGGRGSHSVGWFRGVPGVRIVALSDADSDHLSRHVKRAKEDHGETVKGYVDARKMLDDPDVDAVVISTCNHTHSIYAILACQAGKDVYVEKPVCHTIWEGLQLAEAARRTKRIVAAGLQNRSDVGLNEFFPYLHEGNLGKVTMVRGLCYKNRSSIGKRDTPMVPPATLDYNLWLGPAQDKPIYRPKLHYDWHWDFNTGNGDIGNQGPHEWDLIRWALKDPGMPKGVYGFGGRFGWDDAGETPNMQFAALDYGVPVLFEVNDLKLKPDLNAGSNFQGIRIGVVITCEGGEFRGGRGGGWVYDTDGKKMKQFTGDAGGSHAQNFIEAVRMRKQSHLRSPVDSAVVSSNLAHLANISVLTGRAATDQDLRKQDGGNEHNTEFLDRIDDQMKAWNVDYGKTPWMHGGLAFDGATHRFTGDNAGAANALLHRKDRPEFAIPKLV